MPDKYSADMTLGELLENEETEKFLKSLPGMAQLIESPQAQMAMGFSLRQIQEYSESMAPGQFTRSNLKKLTKD